MNQAEWTATKSLEQLFEFLESSASDRKCRLFSVACVRRAWPSLVSAVIAPHPSLIEADEWSERSRQITEHCRILVEVTEQFADGKLRRTEFYAARRQVENSIRDPRRPGMLGGWAKHMPVSIVQLIAMRNGIRAALETADAIAWQSPFAVMATHMAATQGQHAADKFVTRNPHLRAQCDLLRDIFNPFFRGPPNTDWLTWNNATIPRLAQTIYDDRRYDIMPILGDALEDAGCGDEKILEHCRGPGPHVRGCWVIDLILGKS